jgi:hypothetical protein
LGSYTPAFLKTSAQMGTVELTGLAMMARWALGQYLAQAVARSLTMEALVCGENEAGELAYTIANRSLAAGSR